MPLSPGTSLHNGNYVIDAWRADDDLGSVYLATHIPTGQWVQLRGMNHPDSASLPSRSDRQRLTTYWQTVAAQARPRVGLHLDGFDDEGTFYQVLIPDGGRALGQSLACLAPLPAATVLPLMRQLAALLQGMRPLGWYGLWISPEQIWLHPAAPERLTFTGFGLVPSAASPDQPWASTPEPDLVRQISGVLYFALTGLRPDATLAPLAVDLHNRHPDLPHGLTQALEYGLQSQHPSVSLARWQGLLSEPSPKPAVVPTPVVHLPPPASPRHRWPLYGGLGITAGVASLAGVALGLQLRLQPQDSVSQPFLAPEQAFPPLSDWPGQATPAAVDSDFPQRLERYSDIPPRPAPTISPPIVPTPPIESEVPVVPLIPLESEASSEPSPVQTPPPVPRPPQPEPEEPALPPIPASPETNGITPPSPPPSPMPSGSPASPPSPLETTSPPETVPSVPAAPAPPTPAAPAPIAPAPVAPAPVAPAMPRTPADSA